MTDKNLPILNANLLEGLLAECVSQIKMSLDCCRDWKKSNLSLTDNIFATKIITRDEVWNVVDVTQFHTAKSARKKHWYFMERCRRYLSEEKAIVLEKGSGETQGHADALQLIIKFLGDAHLILHENTPENIKEYLTYGGEIKELKRRGKIYTSPVRLASRRKVAKGSRGSSQRGGPVNSPSGVRERGEGSDSGSTSRSSRQNNTSLERVGGLAKVRTSSSGHDSPEGSEHDRAESGGIDSRGDSGDRGSSSSTQSSDLDSNGNDERSTSKSDGVSERGSVQAATGDQGSVGDRKERVVFGSENVGLGRPGEDFDNGYLRSIERHGKHCGEEGSSHRGEILAMKQDLLEMIEGLQQAVEDMDRFEGGNDAAGRRVRKVCSEVAKSCKGIRVSVQELRNDRKG